MGEPAKEEIKIPVYQKLVVGAIAGIVGTSAVFPIDVVKTRLQNQSPDPVTKKLPYRGIIHAFRTIYVKEGLRSFYNGIGPNLVGVTPEKAIKLAANDFFCDLLQDSKGDISLGNRIVAGGMAGFLQVSATNPMEIVKLRMQLQNLKPAAERLTSMQVVNNLGLRGLYKGVAVTWMRDVPYSIIFFPGYALLLDALTKDGTNAGITQIVTAGAVAGAAAAGLCTPADCIKTRFQAEGSQYKSIRDCYQTTVRNEGYAALFKGVVPRMSVTAPLFGIAQLFFVMQKRYIRGEPLL
eukprot:m.240379 g.240379  ORF g.240379 m.240379 type:complete len:294 (-) comp19413_c0_seq1:406-1287(-)